MAELFRGYIESTEKTPHSSVIADKTLSEPPKRRLCSKKRIHST